MMEHRIDLLKDDECLITDRAGRHEWFMIFAPYRIISGMDYMPRRLEPKHIGVTNLSGDTFIEGDALFLTWAEENNIGPYNIVYGDGAPRIVFENLNDAILFKMRWLG